MLSNIFKPIDVEFENLVRIGPNFDGGYVIDKRIINLTKTIISCGLNDDWEFEKHFLKLNINCKVIVFDHNVDKKFWIKRFIKDILHFFLLKKLRLSKILGIFKYINYTLFFKGKNKHHIKKIAPKDFEDKEISISTILKNYTDVLLKIDIEGDEYKILSDININSNKIICLIIEFHNIDNNFKLIENFIKNNKLLKLIHIHGNNFAGLNKKDDPNVLELIFLNAEKISLNLNKTMKTYPIEDLDFSNYPRKKDLIIKFND